MSPDFIIDVDELSFEFEVIQYSRNTPVVVDFWAPWCVPCKTLTPILEKLAIEAQGEFRLAKVNVDENQNLTLKFGVRSIPTIIAFSQASVAGEFVGLQPENRIREFIKRITPPSETQLRLEKAQGILEQQDYWQAEEVYREILTDNPGNPEGLLGLAKSLLAQGIALEPVSILENFPTSPFYQKAETLKPYAKALKDFHENSLDDTDELDATFFNCIRLAERGNYPSALDGLLDILRQDKNYRNDRARLVILGILEIMGTANPQTRQYRSELASILF